MSTRTIRLLGLISVPTALMLFVLAPIQSYVWGSGGPDVPAWIRSMEGFQRWAQETADRFGGGLDAYHFWGRFMTFTFAGAALGIWAFRRLAAPGTKGWRIMLVALVAGAILDAGGYWGATFSGISMIMAGMEFFTLPLLIIGTIRATWVYLRSKATPRWPGYVLLGASIGFLPSMVLIAYWPHGFVLPVAIAAAVLAVGAAAGVRVTVPPAAVAVSS
jgi:hypothetical protein